MDETFSLLLPATLFATQSRVPEQCTISLNISQSSVTIQSLLPSGKIEMFDLKSYNYLTIKSLICCALTAPDRFLSLTFFSSPQHLRRFVFALAEGGLIVFISNNSFIL
jgi:hypothetical protein